MLPSLASLPQTRAADRKLPPERGARVVATDGEKRWRQYANALISGDKVSIKVTRPPFYIPSWVISPRKWYNGTFKGATSSTYVFHVELGDVIGVAEAETTIAEAIQYGCRVRFVSRPARR